MSPVIYRRVVSSPGRFSDTVHPLLRRIFAARNVLTDQEIAPGLGRMLSPELLKGISGALDLLIGQIRQQGRILIVSDFDADGATSCALAVQALQAFGFRHVDYIVPNRFEYGYGLTPEIIALARPREPDLIITVDNGISSIEGVRAANESGIEVLITDHHLPGRELPEAAAIVNPNQADCGFPSKALAGVGVVFYLMAALRARLREQGWFEQTSIPEPNMGRFLDLVALGTVADVVPLDENNRILVSEGLKRIRAGRACPGVQALLEIAGKSAASLAASDLGFALGPRLNAAGRLDDMALGIECLLASDSAAAGEMARQLDVINTRRRDIEGEMRDQALAHLETMAFNEEVVPAGLCIHDDDWHQGVIGILASRIKDKLHRPVIAFADAGVNSAGEPEIKGSARSISGLHVRDVLDAVATKNPGLISKFGGHAMAAGLSLLKADYSRFAEAFAAEVARQLTEDDLAARIATDGEVGPGDLTLAMAQLIRDHGPWGQSFPEPCFDGIFAVVQQKVVAEKHLKLVITPRETGKIAALIDAIAFNVDRGIWPNPARLVRLVYRLDINEFRGKRNLQLIIDHLEPAG